MHKTYNLFKKFFPIFLVELFFVLLFGTLSFQLQYNKETCTLHFDNIITILFMVFLVIAVLTALYFSLNIKHIKVSRIRKRNTFLKCASIFATVMVFIIFIYRFILILSFPENVTFVRIIQFFLYIPLGAYFVIGLLPKHIRRQKVEIPQNLQYFLSVCTVLWAIFGIFSMYFYNQEYFFTTNIFKVTQILIYVAFTAFFLFEAKFEHLTPNYKMYVFSAFVCIILTVAFSAGVVVAKVTGAVPSDQSLTEIEVFCSLSIGLYAFARVCALFQTMKYIINEST